MASPSPEMRTLSKSKIIAFCQCPKRLWLEVHRPDLREDSPAAQAGFQMGYQVGEVARRIYDPAGQGAVIDIKTEGFSNALKRSRQLLEAGKQAIFEAGFSHERTRVFADIMLPVSKRGRPAWKMIEVKSSTKLKNYHRDDVAVQAFIARKMGVDLAGVAVAVIDTDWTYPGGSDYKGLLIENDLTDETLERTKEVGDWIRDAHKVAGQKREPDVETGDHCFQPFECGFCNYCNRNKIPAEYPLAWLPRLMPKQKRRLAELGFEDLRDVPENLLSDTQNRVRRHTLENSTSFDQKAARKALRGLGSPAYFLDFETIAPAVPVWPGTRPYQKIPFQFSLHRIGRDGVTTHEEFLDLSGNDPSEAFVQAVIRACGRSGPVFVYNAGFENSVLNDLAERFPESAKPLQTIVNRVFDLLPVAQECFYHPSQCGSWSIKSVLPAAVPELSYENLEGVKDGGMAMEAYAEAIRPETTPERREELRRQLLAYCKMDTWAMVCLCESLLGEPMFGNKTKA